MATTDLNQGPSINQGQSITYYGLRLQPGDDLKHSLKAFALEHQLEAGIILTALGSLNQVALRFAGRSEATILTAPLELLSLTGTLSHQGLHLHGAVADAEGRVYGGHIMAGCRVRTTVEIAIAQLPNLSFRRALDDQTGYLELVVEPLPSPTA
jgi:uncharacterized protein